MKEEQKKHGGIHENPFERNNYYYGKLMTAREFLDEQCYYNEKRWLINRMVNGWGVVCGLDVKRKPLDPKEPDMGYDDKNVLVTPGLAIDCFGREILVQEEQLVPLIPEKDSCINEEQAKNPEKLSICIEYRECKTEPILFPSKTCDHDDKTQFNRIRDSFKIHVRIEKGEPHSGKCCPLHEEKFHKGDIHHPFVPRTLHNYLCEKLKKGCPECLERPCLVLAEITQLHHKHNYDKNEQIQQTSYEILDRIKGIKINRCSKRRLVYSNPLLYDLIQCYHGDLPHIIDISWSDLHAKEDIEWDVFTDILDKGLTVTFDKVMETDTINRHAFLFAAIMEEEGTGYRQIKYIPSAEKVFKHTTKEIQDKEVSLVTFEVEPGWKEDEIEGVHSEIARGADFEIILRGSSILSNDKKALDGDFVGGKFPTGNGTQGGDFVSWFSVAPRENLPKIKRTRLKTSGQSEE